ncbi:hypothetical protein [Streptomyces rubradiris]|uniref:Uncharacterized protein n=1 Tax=Streptomyces rubradiris TaxID=285531 RepID=A0ABQ3RDK6_STRRR|nr:hypothetical protein [Streptomyces rubradiris]GHH29669.1 hypothetical protein GCM10018792_75100 [Streptomyces rubradiris]GHI53929.1 hypothetical protein Srubr_37750 [Streptomyces rubradiris]
MTDTTNAIDLDKSPLGELDGEAACLAEALAARPGVLRATDAGLPGTPGDVVFTTAAGTCWALNFHTGPDGEVVQDTTGRRAAWDVVLPAADVLRDVVVPALAACRAYAAVAASADTLTVYLRTGRRYACD